MFDVLSHSFFAARRGICPTCGGALELAGTSRQCCAWCGSESVLERRLLQLGDEPSYQIGDDERRDDPRLQHTRWLLEEFGAIELAPVTCPGCGADFEVDSGQRTVRCGHCGTQSRLERRLRCLGPETLERPQRRNYQDFALQARGESSLRWDVETEQLCWRIIEEADPDRRAALARQVAESWCYSNATLAYFMPWLLALATREHGLVAEWLVQGVGKLLCQEDRRLWLPVLEACGQFAFNVSGPTALLHEIGLGKAVCLRLLLDVAEYAWNRGARDYAVNATWAVTTLIDRNFGDHKFIGEVMLHRLYYLSGPVLGWAIDKISSGMGGYLFKDAHRLIRFVDELAAERPAIAAVVATPIRFLSPQTDSGYRARLELLATLKTQAAREATLSNLYPPQPVAESTAEAAVTALVPLFEQPELSGAAVKALAAFIGGPGQTPAAIERLVEERGESLPERLRVEYHWKFPETRKLDRQRIVEWQSPPEPPELPEVVAARVAWDQAIRDAVARREERRDAWREQRDRVRALDVPIYDRPRDEPPTAPPAAAPADGEVVGESDGAGIDREPPEVAAALQCYLKRMDVLQAELARLAAAQADLAPVMAQMQEAVADYTRACTGSSDEFEHRG